MGSGIRLREGWRALQALIQNPDDTEQAFRVVAALSGNSAERLRRRFARTAPGADLLRSRPPLGSLLADRERLLAMPAGSLGRAMADFYEREQISAEGLASASEDAMVDGTKPAASDATGYVMLRLRDQHDMLHVLTGYGRDIRGELAVLAFTGVQTRNPGVAAIPLYLLFRAGPRSELGRLVLHGLQRGLRAPWLVDQPWETLMERPLAELREQLRLGPPPSYEAVRSAGAPALEQTA